MRRSILLLLSFILMSLLSMGQCYTLNGKITNAINSQALSATFTIKTGVRKLVVGKSGENGMFTIKLPCNSIALIIEQPGFRTVEMPMSGNEGSYYFELGLYPVDRQIIDRPYFQSEQTDIVLNNSDSSQTDKTASRLFKLIDLQTKAPVKGEVCLYYTKTGEKKCFVADGNSKEAAITFDHEDIIGVVVRVNDYQPYNGNLIITKLDNSSLIYEIGLSKMISMFAFSYKASTPVKFELTDIKKTLVPMKTSGSFGYAMVKTDDSYIVKAKNAKGQIVAESSSIRVHGLSLLTLDSDKQPEKPVITPIVQATTASPENNPERLNDKEWKDKTIYFKQSTYDLSIPAKLTLDSVSVWLKQNRFLIAEITGFTDNIGNAQKNLTLSEFRAKVTRKYLMDKGAAETQLQIRAMGGKSPAGANDNEETKILNRRVEIKLFAGNSSQAKSN